ncbi:MAG: alkaline phosphatase family protein, partial [Desulfobacteraceae bacterium]|nr:alkaline phosphatase family protein [Desulfobacteraceae bacterium]
MAVKILICLDGCSPEYLAKSSTPNLDSLARGGFKTIGQAVIPSVTNVNNTSIVTASFPESHGITSNYYLDPNTGREFYMESPEYLLAETMFKNAEKKGLRSALLTAKGKLNSLIREGATVAESAEKPPAWLVERLGPPPEMYSVEINHWLFRAAAEVIEVHRPDLIYVTTTDYAMHTLAPDDEKSQWNLGELDRLLGNILNAAGAFEIVVTADLGMNA